MFFLKKTSAALTVKLLLYTSFSSGNLVRIVIFDWCLIFQCECARRVRGRALLLSRQCAEVCSPRPRRCVHHGVVPDVLIL